MSVSTVEYAGRLKPRVVSRDPPWRSDFEFLRFRSNCDISRKARARRYFREPGAPSSSAHRRGTAETTTMTTLTEFEESVSFDADDPDFAPTSHAVRSALLRYADAKYDVTKGRHYPGYLLIARSSLRSPPRTPAAFLIFSLIFSLILTLLQNPSQSLRFTAD